MNCLSDAHVRPAAAEIAAHSGINFAVRRAWVFGEQRRGRHNLARLAITALRHVQVDPCFLQRVRAIGRESFNRGDLLAGNTGEGRLAGAYGFPSDLHRAGPALTDAASVFGSMEVERIPKGPQKRSIGC